MTDDEIGYGQPPKRSQFKPGVSGNPQGRPKRKPAAVSEVIKTTLSAPIQYREQGRTKTATRAEVGLKKLVENAVMGVNRRWNGTPYRHPKGTPLIGVFCW
jgi:hypothetical protein